MSERTIDIKGRGGRRRFDPAAFFETAAKGRTISKHRKGEIIFLQGDDANAVFYIKKGKIKVTVVSKQGKEAVVAILGTDEFAGVCKLFPAMATIGCALPSHFASSQKTALS